MFSSRSVSRHGTGSWKRQSGLKERPFVWVFCAMAVLEVDGVAVHGHRRLHHSLAQRRMRMDVPAKLPRVALEELRQRRLGNELCRLRPDDVRAKHLAGLGVRDDLHETRRVAMDLSPADGGEREAPHFHFVSFLPGLLFGQTDGSDLRVRVGASRDELLFHRSCALPGYVLRSDDSLM